MPILKKIRSSEKIFYEVDPYSRLVINKSGLRGGLHKFRKVLDGRFRLDEGNSLSYHIKAPCPEGEEIPHQVKLTGEWFLTDGHDLRFILDKEGRRTFGDQITLHGRIAGADKSSLAFSVATKTGDGDQATYILNLQGSWMADDNNRLAFYVEREKGRHDILTFNGAWDVGRSRQLVYRYEKASLIRKKREGHALTFKGHWDISQKSRVSYVLDASSNSAFDFRSSIGTLSAGYIKYEVGIGLRHRARPVTRIVTLFGRWKPKKGAGLLFEVEYGGERTFAIAFGADVALTNRGMVSFKLKSGADGKDLGMTLELSRRVLAGDGELFLRGLASKSEAALYGGAAWRW